MLLHAKIRDSYVHPQFIADVIKPLQIENVFDQEVGLHEDNKRKLISIILHKMIFIIIKC